MIGFFSPDGLSSFTRLDRIERFGKRSNWDGEEERCFAEMIGGERFEMSILDRDTLLRRPVQLIPAELHTNIIEVGEREGKPWMFREPVIAWALCVDGEIRAVPPSGVPCDTGQAIYVEMPDGKIAVVGEWGDPCGFDSADAMQAYFVGMKSDASDGAFG